MSKIDENLKALRGKLTIPQQRFAEEYVRGIPAYKAYQNAGYICKSDIVAQASSSKTLRVAKVKAYIVALRDLETNNAILSRNDRMEALSRMQKANEKGGSGVAIRAIKELNLMTGEYRAESVNLSGDVTLYEAITGRRRKA
jgi:phage terminase small subunit